MNRYKIEELFIQKILFIIKATIHNGKKIIKNKISFTIMPGNLYR